MRTPIIGGNWKMNLNAGDGADLAESIAEGLARGPLGAEVVMFPAFPYLALIADVVESAPPMLGAQDAHHEASGAFTGEVSLPMLEDCGVEWVLVGHSERRHVIGESI
ncbi:MAG: triose-phosphate isomerase, partial [Planctomycetota bacterium]|nr:triose-phosphate isomerase [Planctomycetota bacterium]